MKGIFTRTSKLLADYADKATNLTLKILQKNYLKFILYKVLRIFIFERYKLDNGESIFFRFITFVKKKKKVITLILTRNKSPDLFKSYVYIYNK